MTRVELAALNAELGRLFQKLNARHFENRLPLIDVRFSGRLRSTGGQYFRSPTRLIQVSLRYFEMDNPWDEIFDTLGHEMIHYWLDFHGKPYGHTIEFRRKLDACGFNRYSRLRPVHARYLYICPSCNVHYYRRKRGTWSCGPCSGPRYNPEYKLMLTAALSMANP